MNIIAISFNASISRIKQVKLLTKYDSYGIDFKTCLHAAFTCADPKSPKRQSSHRCLFALFDLRAQELLVNQTMVPKQMAHDRKLGGRILNLYKSPGNLFIR